MTAEFYQKTTEELFNEIKQADDMEEYMTANNDDLWDPSLAEYFNLLIDKYQIKKSEIFKKAGLVGNNYGYEIFRDDRKKPSRDILIQISLAFPLDIDETQQVLRRAGKAILYPRDKRDAYILFALKKGMSIDELNAKLIENELSTLGAETRKV